MAKKRPSLRNFLVTGEVITEEEPVTAAEESRKEETAEKTPAGRAAKKSSGAKKTDKKRTKKPAAKAKAKAAPAGGERASAEKKAPRLTPEEAELVGMLAPEDRAMWEKLFGTAETEFLPLDLVERREDFRTMPRDRFTLFRLEEAGEPLSHVRTSVQIREPLVCLIKWDETGRISVFR